MDFHGGGRVGVMRVTVIKSPEGRRIFVDLVILKDQMGQAWVNRMERRCLKECPMARVIGITASLSGYSSH